MAMRRGDRRTSDDDNALNNPRTRQSEPATLKELKASNQTLRARNKTLKYDLGSAKEELETQSTKFLSLREDFDRSQILLQERDERIVALEAANKTYKQRLAEASQQAAISSNENFKQLYAEALERVQAEQQTSENNLALYKKEQLRAESLQSQFSHAEAERERFIALYSGVQAELKSERDYKINVEEWKDRVNKLQTQSERSTQLLQVAQSDLETARTNLMTLQLQYDDTLGLYHQEQETAKQHLALYEQEQARAEQLQVKFAASKAEREQLSTLNLDLQTELKKERRSKAGIKGWETRRKRENAKLKQEISEMANILQKAMAEKDTAIGELYDVADRMDRIQRLVDSVDEETTSGPMGLLQKFKLAWDAIQDIFSE